MPLEAPPPLRWTSAGAAIPSLTSRRVNMRKFSISVAAHDQGAVASRWT